MSIFLGSSQLQGLFGTAVNAGSGASAFSNPAPPISGAAVALNAGLFTNTTSYWTNYNGDVFVQNAPLVGTSSIGFEQFNGTNDELFLSGGLYTNGLFQGTNGAQSFTMMFYGTVGDLSQRRALLGTPNYTTTPSGSDAIFRTDTSPASGYCHLDLRSKNAGSGFFNRFSIPYSSGSIMNFAITYDATTTSASLYVDGLLTATSGGFNGFQYTPFYNNGGNGPIFGNNTGQDAINFNGTLGGFYVYNRILTGTQISQSAAWFSQGNTVVPAQSSGIQDINSAYLGSNLVYTKPTTTTTTTTSTTSTTTTSTTTTLAPLSVMTLVVGGGGEGGTGTGGGGGAGGVVYSSSLSLIPGTYVATVGTGGNGYGSTSYANNALTQSGQSGVTSSLSSGSVNVLAFGGGGGAAFGAAARPGGSGGGGSNPASFRTAAAGTTGMGFAGTTVTSDLGCGGGGGGAAQTATFRNRAPGGSGSAYTIRNGNSVFYGGGGGAGDYNTDAGGEGGVGGGGAGGTVNVNGGAGVSGSINTGGGGGGGNRNADGTVNGRGGQGGSGIIVIAYTTASAAGRTITGGIETTYTSASLVYKSHTFLSSSNLVIS
jgi:hypothetical protein